jgi:hypothetical protein
MGSFRKSITNGSIWLEGFYSKIDKFDLFGVQTQYKVKVLSDPTVNGDRMTFRGRIIDDRMAHRIFLPDPCDDSIASDVSFNQAIANLHSLITVKNANGDLAKSISRDDIVIVSLATGDNNTKYNLQNAKFVRVYEKFNTNSSTNTGCTSLKDLPYTSAGTLGSTGGSRYTGGSYPRSAPNAPVEAYSVNDIIFESVAQPAAAARTKMLHQAIGKAGKHEGNATEFIIDEIHAKNVPAFSGVPDSFTPAKKKYYMDILTTKKGAWSSWFLNTAYIDKSTPGFPQHQKHARQNSGYEGCCYPNALAAINRSNVMNEPEKYIGQTLLMVFSKDETNSDPSLNLVPGDASVVGQTHNKSWEETRLEFANVSGKTHMNIYVGQYDSKADAFIGGNLGGRGVSTTAVKYDINKNSFMKLVKIVGVKNPASTPVSTTGQGFAP